MLAGPRPYVVVQPDASLALAPRAEPTGAPSALTPREHGTTDAAANALADRVDAALRPDAARGALAALRAELDALTAPRESRLEAGPGGVDAAHLALRMRARLEAATRREARERAAAAARVGSSLISRGTAIAGTVFAASSYGVVRGALDLRAFVSDAQASSPTLPLIELGAGALVAAGSGGRLLWRAGEGLRGSAGDLLRAQRRIVVLRRLLARLPPAPAADELRPLPPPTADGRPPVWTVDVARTRAVPR